MSFVNFERSRNRGEPINLFLFEYGQENTIRLGFTDFEQPITHDGVTYNPDAIQRASVNASGTLDKQMLNIDTDKDSPIAELFRIYPPSSPVRVTILQGHADDIDKQFLVIWTGRVLNAKWNNSEVQLSCEPIASSLRRPGLRRRYQHACPHVLYGPVCRANKAASTVTATLAESISGARVALVNGLLNEIQTQWLRNGTLEWLTPEGNLEARTILSVHVAESQPIRLVLSGVVLDLPSGHQVNLVYGCGHNLTDCETIHANLPNYGGMPWIPTKNPFGKYSPYY